MSGENKPTKKEMDDKSAEYAVKICAKIAEMFDESEGDYKIDLKELSEGDNMTHFVHALANIMPSHYYERLTHDALNLIDFNHIANKLCFQYCEKSSE